LSENNDKNFSQSDKFSVIKISRNTTHIVSFPLRMKNLILGHISDDENLIKL